MLIPVVSLIVEPLNKTIFTHLILNPIAIEVQLGKRIPDIKIEISVRLGSTDFSSV